MPIATITSKGQVTVPKEIRDALKVGTGDRLDFVVEAEAKVVVRPVASGADSIKGLLRRKGRRAVSLHAMDAAIARAHRRRR